MTAPAQDSGSREPGKDTSMSTMPSSSMRWLALLALATLILMYAAGVQDRELVHALVQRLDGPLLGVLLGLSANQIAAAGGRS